MPLREINRTEFQRLAVSILTALPPTSTEVAWLASTDDSYVGVVLHDHSKPDWRYIIYRRRWGICLPVAQVDGFSSCPDAALRMHMQEMVLGGGNGQPLAPDI